ncbi:MAG: D-Ala-D-Ala carboxypeptidase family metallohydrolase [Thermotogota bacterium]|nr:D-Ala-D-Ala carboxypeptidase family metallohydrolase [Thermotogota bacterium]
MSYLNTGNITKNFSYAESACKCGCGLNRICFCLPNRLQVFSDILQTPIIVTSWCRCETHNENEGGADNSYHLPIHTCSVCGAENVSLAVDITILNRWRMKKLAKLCKYWSGGYHYYPDKNIIHLDIRGYKARW